MSTLSPVKQALLALESMQAKLDEQKRAAREPIAIVGMGCRFPGGANDPAAFWDLLREGRDAIVDVPADRWDVEAYWDPDPQAPGKTTTRSGGFLQGVDVRGFDAAFFGIAPREASAMDPQQRLLLEVAWEALEDAGLKPSDLAGSATGVFVGISGNEYGQIGADLRGLEGVDPYSGTGNVASVAAGRLSYFLGLHGPSFPIDTACSSSLVATHLACQSLRLRECDTALVAGVGLILAPGAGIYFSKLRATSDDGRCRTFDASASGYGRGEGCGVVALKRLADAIRDGDRVRAVIRGSAVNHDGRSNGLTAPHGPSQEAVIRRALEMAEVAPRDVGYVEAHGTGTPLGDPIEVRALAGVFRPRNTPLLIGSVKTNIGHLEAAAGVAGLIKTVLTLEKSVVPPHLHLKQLSPYVDLASIPAEVPTACTPWPEGRPRISGLSSFGFSGTNAHLVIAAADSADSAGTIDTDQPLPLVLSARTPAALARLIEDWRRYAPVAEREGTTLADAVFTQARRRTAAPVRAGFTVRTWADVATLGDSLVCAEPLTARLRAWTNGASDSWVDLIPAGRVVSVPTTPWQREPFWFSGTPSPVRAPQAHPFLGEAIALAHEPGSQVVSGCLDAKARSWLRDHRVQGASILPAAAFIEIALAAARTVNPDVTGLVDISFERVLPIGEDDIALQVVIDGEGRVRVFARSEGGSFALHAQARVETGHGVSEAPPPMPEGSATGDLSTDSAYALLNERGLEYGPAFRGLRRLSSNGELAVADIELSGSASRERRFVVHPALLDAAFHAVALTGARAGGAFLPKGLARFRVFGKVSGAARALVRLNGEPAICLMGADGEVVALAEGLRSAPLSAPNEESRYETEWRALPRQSPPSPNHVLLIGDPELAATLEAAITHRGGTAFAAGLDALTERDHQRSIVVLVPPLEGQASLSRDEGWPLVLRVLQAAATHTPPVRVTVVTRAAQAVTSDDSPSAAAAAVWGLAATAALEHPTVGARRIDLSRTPVLEEIGALADEVLSNDAEDRVALRGTGRWVERLVKGTWSPATLRLDPSATYLITGGLGTLGLLTAERLQARGARDFVLVGRRGSSQEAESALQALRARGASVTVVAADLSQRAEVARVLAGLSKPLGGIVHAAGILDDGVLTGQTRERMERVIAAKAQSAAYLDELTRDSRPPWFVMFSSQAALFGGPGQAPYAAANAALGAVALARRAAGLHALAIAFGPWHGLGMAARVQRGPGLEAGAALDALEALITIGHVHAAVLPPTASFDAVPIPLVADFRRAAPAGPRVREALLAETGGARRERVLGHLQGWVASALGLTDDRVPYDTPLDTLGLDSLMSLDLSNRLESELSVNVPVVRFLAGPTLAMLADDVLDQLVATALARQGGSDDALHEIEL